MTLQQIEEIILQTVGYTRYSVLSIDTSTEPAEDFAILHKCVWMARTEILRGTNLPGMMKHATNISTVAGTKRYTISDTDFDIPLKVRYDDGTLQKDLVKAVPDNILDYVDDVDTQGTPTVYMMFGSTAAGLSYIELYNVPDTSSQTVSIDYLPVLANLTASTDEDLIMKKYPETVIKIASAYVFQIIKKDMVNFEKWFMFGKGDFKAINMREQNYDPNLTARPDDYLIKTRTGRRTI